MKFLTHGAVAGIFGTLLVASIGVQSAEESIENWWSQFISKKPEDVSSSESGSILDEEEQKALSTAMNAISNSFKSTLSKIKEEAKSVRGSFGAAEQKMKASLRRTADLLKNELTETKKEMVPLWGGIKSYFKNTHEDLSLLIPAKEIAQGMAHLVRLTKEKRKLTMNDSNVKRFVLRLINIILVFSSLFSFYVITATGPLVWSMLLAPLAIFNVASISASSIAQESDFQEAEAREAELIVERASESGVPVDSESSRKIAGFLRSISNAELEKMALESGALSKTGLTLKEFPERFRQTVSSWFGEGTQHTPL